MIYCRVSTKEQVEEGNSLATQERNCRDYAAKHDYEVTAVYIEQGESAKTTDRTELKKLLAFCTAKKNDISAVIAYKIDRISRNTDDYSQIRLQLKRFGVEIKSTSEVFEDTPAGRFMENIIANVAQFDNDVRAERCAGGMKDAVREGRYVWMAPYGYSNVRVNGKATIAPNEKAMFVKMVFEEVAKQQYPILEIKRRLYAKGMMGNTGKPIAQSYFYAMLRNKLYTGLIQKFGEEHQGTFEPIISKGLFHTVQTILSRKKKSAFMRKVCNPDFPLRTFFMHPSGKALTGCWSQGRRKKYPYYLMHGHNINIRKEILESTFIDWLNMFKLHIDYFEKLYDQVKRHTNNAMQDYKKKTDEINKQISDLKEKQAAILEKNIDGIISNEMAKEAIGKIDGEIYTLSEQSKTVSAPSSHNLTDLLDATRKVLLHPGEVWNKAGIEAKIKLQWFYFPHGIMFDGNESRTGKICNIFKGKKEVLTQFSSKVHHQNKKSNTNNWQMLHIEGEHEQVKDIPVEELHEELLKLKTIVSPEKEKASF